jgi:hypothetical protein
MAEDPIATPRAKQPWPFPFNVLHEEWPELKKAKHSFFLCSVVCLLIGGWIVYFLFTSFIIPGKEATIQALHTKSETPPGIYSGSLPSHRNLRKTVGNLQKTCHTAGE